MKQAISSGILHLPITPDTERQGFWPPSRQRDELSEKLISFFITKEGYAIHEHLACACDGWIVFGSLAGASQKGVDRRLAAWNSRDTNFQNKEFVAIEKELTKLKPPSPPSGSIAKPPVPPSNQPQLLGNATPSRCHSSPPHAH